MDSAKQAKLPDFISRLKGHLDVLGINMRDYRDTDVKRIDVMVKRAILLRSLLERHAKPILRRDADGQVVVNIHREVIDTLLDTDKVYVHGARSMEALIQMARWVHGEFVPASLPSANQIEMHYCPAKRRKTDKST